MVLVLMVAGGCHVPARVFWSADGQRGVYINYGQIAVIDADGKIQFQGEGEGTAQWSADGSTAYFALKHDQVPGAPATTPLAANWAGGATPDAPADADPEDDGDRLVVVSWTDADGVKPLFTLHEVPLHLHLSPDGQWLAVVAQGNRGSEQMSVYAWHLPSQALYLVWRNSGFAAAFTGDNRLALVVPDEQEAKPGTQTGRLIEVTLDPQAAALEQQTLVRVLAGETIWIERAGDDLLFTARQRNFPAAAEEENPSESALAFALFQYTRADGSLNVIAERVGALFALSPDGQRILFEQAAKGEDDADQRLIMLMNRDGSGTVALRDISRFGNTLPAYPMWCGNDRITFVPENVADAEVDQTDRNWRRTDLVRFVLKDDPQSPLEAERVLSGDWAHELKPRFQAD